MSNFLRLTTLALTWGKLGRVWRWFFSHRLEKPVDVQSSFAWKHSPNKLWNLIHPQHSQHYYRRFIINILVGSGILLLAFLFRDSAFLEGIENEGIDTLMQIRRQVIPANEDIPNFVLLDIDDNTHQAWNAPLFTPRDRLRNLIDAAVMAEARLVIVDVDLSRKTPMEGLEKYTQGLKNHPYDQALSDYFGGTNCNI
jgi:CHASE2 domain-containing sensor protein